MYIQINILIHFSCIDYTFLIGICIYKLMMPRKESLRWSNGVPRFGIRVVPAHSQKDDVGVLPANTSPMSKLEFGKTERSFSALFGIDCLTFFFRGPPSLYRSSYSLPNILRVGYEKVEELSTCLCGIGSCSVVLCIP